MPDPAAPPADPNTPPAGDPPAGDPPAAPPAGDPPPGDPPAGDPPAEPPALSYFDMQSMPPEWRNLLAGGDEGKTGRLERYSDMPKVMDAFFSQQDVIRAGEVSNGLPENATDEQLANYRVANGIPEEATGYELNLEEGLVLGEEDTKIMEGIYSVAHAGNVSTDVVSAMTTALLKGRQVESEAIATEDNLVQHRTTQTLKEAWGGDYTTNINMVDGLLNQIPGEVKELFETSRLANGQYVLGSPEMMVFLADVARKLDPAGVVVPNGGNQPQAIADEIADIESKMGTDEYFKDNKMQARYRDLITAREAMNKKRA